MADYLTKVIKLEILKPEKWVSERSGFEERPLDWNEMKRHLWNLQRISARFANSFVTERYLCYQLNLEKDEWPLASKINNDLRQTLEEEGFPKKEDLELYATKGALRGTVYSAVDKNVVQAQFTGDHFKSLVKLERSLPTFKRTMPIYIRADNKSQHRRIFLDADGDHKLDLMVTVGQYMRVVLRTRKIDGSTKVMLDKLVAETDGYSQQMFLVTYNQNRRK